MTYSTVTGPFVVFIYLYIAIHNQTTKIWSNRFWPSRASIPSIFNYKGARKRNWRWRQQQGDLATVAGEFDSSQGGFHEQRGCDKVSEEEIEERKRGSKKSL